MSEIIVSAVLRSAAVSEASSSSQFSFSDSSSSPERHTASSVTRPSGVFVLRDDPGVHIVTCKLFIHTLISCCSEKISWFSLTEGQTVSSDNAASCW